MLQKEKQTEKQFQNCSYSDDDVTNYVNFLKNYATKQTKYRKRNKISSPCVEYYHDLKRYPYEQDLHL